MEKAQLRTKFKKQQTARARAFLSLEGGFFSVNTSLLCRRDFTSDCTV